MFEGMSDEEKRAYCAAAAHEFNLLYCLAMGDHSQVHWASAPTWQRDSVLKGVEGILAGNDPRASHESWLEVKRAEGWKYGPVKDIEKKEHNCFLPYDELPLEQRVKDVNFRNVVKTMAVALNLLPAERRVEIQVGDRWFQTRIQDLRPGDKFRLFEADGAPVDNGVISTALGAPYPTGNTWGIQTDA